MQNDHPTKIDLVAAIEDSHMKTLVTVGGEYFGVEGIGKGGAGGSDGDVYLSLIHISSPAPSKS